MIFLKEHLISNNYDWDNNTVTVPDEGPTRRRFDRFNGNCVLYMLNLFDRFVGELTLEDAGKIERLLQEKLPMETKSEVSVFNWLKEKHLQSSN